MSDVATVTLPSGTRVTCSKEQAARYQAAEKPDDKKAPAKKAASKSDKK